MLYARLHFRFRQILDGFQCSLDFFRRELMVLQFPLEVRVICCQVNQAVSAPVQRGLSFLFLLLWPFCASCITAASAWQVSGALMNPSVLAQVTPAAKVSSCCTALRLNQVVQYELAHQRRHSVIAEDHRHG